MLRIDFDELKAAIKELEARGKPGLRLSISMQDKKVVIGTVDRYDNPIEVILYDERNLGAEIKVTERLMFMKAKS